MWKAIKHQTKLSNKFRCNCLPFQGLINPSCDLDDSTFCVLLRGPLRKQHMNDKQQGSFLLDFPTPAIAPGWPPELFQPKLMCIYIYIYINKYTHIHSHEYLNPVCPLFWCLNPPKRRAFPFKTMVTRHLGSRYIKYTYIYIVYKTPRDPITFWEWSWNLNTFRFGGGCWPQSSSNKVIGSLEYMYINRWYIWPKYNISPRADWHAWDFSRFPETSATFWRFLVVWSHYTLTKYIP